MAREGGAVDVDEGDAPVLEHQRVVLALNLARRALKGHVELTFSCADTPGVLRAHCFRLRIRDVRVNGVPAHHVLADPFASASTSSRAISELSEEMAVSVPPHAVVAEESGRRRLVLRIEYAAEDPGGGVHFALPSKRHYADRPPHAFSDVGLGAQRQWMPCIERRSARCTWDMEIAVAPECLAVASGVLEQQVLVASTNRRIFHFAVRVPASALDIGFAAGRFEAISDPEVPHVTFFAPLGLAAELAHATESVSRAVAECCRYLDIKAAPAGQTARTRQGAAGNPMLPYRAFGVVFVDACPAPFASFAGGACVPLQLLHSRRVLDQTRETRATLVRALACQWFGHRLYAATHDDEWLVAGIASVVADAVLRSPRLLGANEMQHEMGEWIDEYAKRTTVDNIYRRLGVLHCHNVLHPPVPLGSLAGEQIAWDGLRGPVRIAAVARAVGPETMRNVVRQFVDGGDVDVKKFERKIRSLTSKDVGMQRCTENAVLPEVRFKFVEDGRKLIIMQKEDSFAKGKLLVRWRETDGTEREDEPYVDKAEFVFELPSYGKPQRKQSRRIVLATGQEVDLDMDFADKREVPVLYLAIDPDMLWLCNPHVPANELEWVRETPVAGAPDTVPEYVWLFQALLERDVVVQERALRRLQEGPPDERSSEKTETLVAVLLRMVDDFKCYYRVRIEAAKALAKCTRKPLGWKALVGYFREKFMDAVEDAEHRTIPADAEAPPAAAQQPSVRPETGWLVRPNRFERECLVDYEMQKGLVGALALCRDAQDRCPDEVVKLLLELLSSNDNSINQFDDSAYVCALIDALVTAAMSAAAATESEEQDGEVVQRGGLKDWVHLRPVLDELVRRINIDRLSPSFRNSVTVALLRALNAFGNVCLLDRGLFADFAEHGQFLDVRIAAMDILVEVAANPEWLTAASEGDDAEKRKVADDCLDNVVQIAYQDPSLTVRRAALRTLGRRSLLAPLMVPNSIHRRIEGLVSGPHSADLVLRVEAAELCVVVASRTFFFPLRDKAPAAPDGPPPADDGRTAMEF